MEASQAGLAPAGVEPTPQPEPVQPQPEAPAGIEGAPSPQPGNEPDLQGRYDQLLAQHQQTQQQLEQYQQAQPSDLVSALQDPGEDFAGLGLTPEEQAVLAADPSQGYEQPAPGLQPGAPADAQFAALEQYVRQAAQQAIAPVIEERQNEQLNSLQEKYPDILQPQIFGEIKNSLLSLGQRSGASDIHLNPQAVEMAYMAVKAKQAEAAAASTEPVATNEASIETNAGQTQQGDQTLTDRITQAMLAESSKDDPFG
jgi:hypothetical protein